MSFGEFYSSGGPLMHAIAIAYLGALVFLVLHPVRKARARGDTKFLEFAERCVAIALVLGVLATCFNVTEWTAGVLQLDDIPGQYRGAIKVAGMINFPLTLACMFAVPTITASMIMRLRVRRTSLAADSAQ